MKQCSKCKKLKDESEFNKQHTTKDGLRFWCRQCSRNYDRKYYKKNTKTTGKYRRYEQCHRIVAGVRQRLCIRCTKWKTEAMFYKNRRSKDGLAWWCKGCADKATNDARRRRTLAMRS